MQSYCQPNFIIKGEQPAEKSISSITSSSFAAVMLPLGTLGIDNNVKKLSNRLIILVICFFGSLVYWSYCAILVALLTVSDIPLTINKLDDMLDRSQFKLYYIEGTASYNYFSKATSETNEVAKKIFEQYKMDVESGKYTNIYEPSKIIV